MHEWVIIGGGIHGCTIANFLLAKGKTTTNKLKIIDPHPEPLAMWKRKTALISMEFLRSPLKSKEEANIYHVYDKKISSLEKIPFPVTLIGGGITATHVAIKLSTLYPGMVTLLKRHPFRIHSFDSHSGWLGPKKLASFQKLKDYGKRRTVINEARHKGSIPRELHRKLIRLEKEKKLSIRDGEVISGETTGEKKIVLRLKDGHTINASSVLLATGFVPSLPDQGWLRNLIKSEQLQCATCGYPIVQSTLEWCNHLYVSGPLSELEIGPVARNISGARKAAERIVLSAT